jgi:hypothetical protein
MTRKPARQGAVSRQAKGTAGKQRAQQAGRSGHRTPSHDEQQHIAWVLTDDISSWS